ncbi:MAG: helix-turn-helix domain-containing protein [Acetatifactor sp.]|nr:helix-turn-helix domain-containing protein [Acetatifactor sp.]
MDKYLDFHENMAERYVGRSWLHDVVPIIYGCEICKPEHSFGPAVRSHYLLHYILEGEGEFFKRGVWHPVKKGDIFVIEPEEVTIYRTGKENTWVYSWIGFEVPKGCVLDFLNSPVIHTPPVRHIFTEIRRHYSEDNFNEQLYLLTCELLLQLSSMYGETYRQNNYAKYTKNYLETVYMQSVSIQEIADSLFIDRRYLTAVFRETYGISPKEYLMEFRLKKARKFLEKGYSVTESAGMAGFSDLPNFSKRYKAYFGTTPSRQRKDFVI